MVIGIRQELAHLGYAAVDLEHCAGHGLAARIESADGSGSAFYLGSASWCGLTSEAVHSWQADDDAQARAASEVFLTQRPLLDSGEETVPGEPVLLARFLISDSLRAEALPLVRQLSQSGLTVHLIHGSGHTRGKTGLCGQSAGQWCDGADGR